MLEGLAPVMDFGLFRSELDAALSRTDRAQGGRSPFDPAKMLRVLVLLTLDTLSDGKAEHRLRDRLPFMRFARVAVRGAVPPTAARRDAAAASAQEVRRAVRASS